MTRIRRVVLLLSALAASAAAGAADFRDLNGNGRKDVYEDESRPRAERVADLLSRMTIEQKVRMVSGVGWSRQGHAADVDKVPGAAGYTYALDELGIPSIVLADGPAGLRISPTRKGDDATYYATAFPVETLLASTWDAALLESVGAAVGNEVKEYGVDLLLAPGMNIHRDPRGGRNFEYYSEDPYLSGTLAAAMVDGVESAGVGATLKHFVANNQETNRYLIDTVVSERALREIYLRGFEIAVKQARPWAIMSAYNQVNGMAASKSKALLTTVLREEWGFDGVVMTDWFAGMDDTVAQMRAGNELLMPGMEAGTEQIRRAVAAGKLDEAVLDRNVRRILDLVLRSPAFAGYRYSDRPDLKAHAEIARAAAAEGVVLLKNDERALPLPASAQRVAAFGNSSYDFISGGTGSGDVNEAYTVSLVQALQARQLEIDPQLKQLYETHIRQEKAKLPEKKFFWEFQPPPPEMPLAAELVARKAQSADVALLTIGRNSGEFQDRPLQGDFYLTPAEHQLIDDVSKAFHARGKKVVLILNIGNVVETVSWRERVDAIVLPWQGGQEAGNAVADVLTGKVNPSGKLPTTFPVKHEDVPSAANFPGVHTSDEAVRILEIFEAYPSRVEYEEGIYVGYRYYDTFDVKPAYEFGYGLSYADFEYGPVSLSQKTFRDSISATVRVKNTGDVAGREVVQLYLGAPGAGATKPVKELKRFAKTRRLAPGESQVLEFSLQPKDLASFNEARSAWLADAGTYTVSIGASSRDLRAKATFELKQDVLVEQAIADLSPPGAVAELSPRGRNDEMRPRRSGTDPTP